MRPVPVTTAPAPPAPQRHQIDLKTRAPCSGQDYGCCCCCCCWGVASREIAAPPRTQFCQMPISMLQITGKCHNTHTHMHTAADSLCVYVYAAHTRHKLGKFFILFFVRFACFLAFTSRWCGCKWQNNGQVKWSLGSASASWKSTKKKELTQLGKLHYLIILRLPWQPATLTLPLSLCFALNFTFFFFALSPGSRDLSM